jgi:hypothetical protein
MGKPGTEVPGSRRNENESREGRHMAHKYPNVLIHCVFNTKNREDLIPDELRFKLWKYSWASGNAWDPDTLRGRHR